MKEGEIFNDVNNALEGEFSKEYVDKPGYPTKRNVEEAMRTYLSNKEREILNECTKMSVKELWNELKRVSELWESESSKPTKDQGEDHTSILIDLGNRASICRALLHGEPKESSK